MKGKNSPPTLTLNESESNLIYRLTTPRKVQRFLNKLPYNSEHEPRRPTLRSFRGVVKHQTAHCMEAALTAAVILEQHHYPPLILSFESEDLLDHVIFVYQQNGFWGSVGRSRDPGLHGRKPVFRTARDLALSYVEPYVDFTGRITGFAVADFRELGIYDWRLSNRNVWKAEHFLQDYPHQTIKSSDVRINRPLYFKGRERWTEIPKDLRSPVT